MNYVHAIVSSLQGSIPVRLFENLKILHVIIKCSKTNCFSDFSVRLLNAKFSHLS